MKTVEIFIDFIRTRKTEMLNDVRVLKVKFIKIPHLTYDFAPSTL